MPVQVPASEPTAARRRIYFQVVAADGITPALTEAGGQPQIATDGGAWTNTGIGVLVSMGFGRYSADLTTGAVATAGARIETRYKSGATAECPGDSVQVVGFDPAADPLSVSLLAGGYTADQVGHALLVIAAEAAGVLLQSIDGSATTIMDAFDPDLPRITSLNTATFSARTRTTTIL